MTTPSTSESTDAAAEIQRFYDSGTPFFTKSDMRNILHQVRAIQRSGTPGVIFMPGLAGHWTMEDFDPRPRIWLDWKSKRVYWATYVIYLLFCLFTAYMVSY